MNRYKEKLYNVLGKDLSKWKYIGGDSGRHNNYFNMCLTKYKISRPPYVDKCACEHHITENCYVYNEDDDVVQVLGNCCIKKFIPKSGRTCEDCGEPHRNRKWNKCHECVTKICFDCGEPNYSGYKSCWYCFMGIEKPIICKICNCEKKNDGTGEYHLQCIYSTNRTDNIDMFGNLKLSKGKYSGYEFKHVYENDKSYVKFLTDKGYSSYTNFIMYCTSKNRLIQ